MKRVSSILMSCFFIGIIFVFGIIMLFKSDGKESEVENRTLMQKPSFNKNTLISGEFFRNYETYFADQFYKRDFFIKAYTQAQLLMNKTMLNNVIIADDHWLMEPPVTSVKRSTYRDSISKLNDLAIYASDNNISLNLALVPHKKNALSFIYPESIKKSVGNEASQYFVSQIEPSIRNIDVSKALLNDHNENQLKDMYFRTDHHWNMKGAFKAYQYIIDGLDEQLLQTDLKKPIDNYAMVCNENARFIGSYNKKIFGLKDYDAEFLCGYYPKNQSDLVKFNGVSSKGQTISEFKEVFGKSMNSNKTINYAGITSNDFAEIKFEYNNLSSINLLILKDSYANAIVPFIAKHFRKTNVIDLRHYHEMNVYDYIEKNNINAILILYNDSNLTGEMYYFDK